MSVIKSFYEQFIKNLTNGFTLVFVISNANNAKKSFCEPVIRKLTNGFTSVFAISNASFVIKSFYEQVIKKLTNGFTLVFAISNASFVIKSFLKADNQKAHKRSHVGENRTNAKNVFINRISFAFKCWFFFIAKVCFCCFLYAMVICQGRW